MLEILLQGEGGSSCFVDLVIHYVDLGRLWVLSNVSEQMCGKSRYGFYIVLYA